MKIIFWIVFPVLVFSACEKPQESLESQLKKADHIELTFQMDGVHRSTIQLSDPAVLDSLSNLLTATKSEPGQCKYGGEIKFTLRDSTIFYGKFNLNEECAHVSFQDGRQTAFRKLASTPMAILKRFRTALNSSKLEKLAWFLGRWSQTEGPDLVSYERWERSTEKQFKGFAWTLYHTDTVHRESIALLWEGDDIFYIPNVLENNGPVRFKLTAMDERSVLFENPEHDFPQKISYEARGDTMLFAKISGIVNGTEMAKEFPLLRAGI